MTKTVELCVQVRAIFPDKDNRDALIESLQKQYESGMIEERIKDMLMECLNEEGKVLQ
ncbi:hypothetical protein [Anaeromusa sp.]|uniref:hypothetical protein n=1 Tax=Anaeromusa sp. TaxID=1872520 RepID=UPI00260516BA|nr:hypothetical protein [Anaeromusa sp.]MDD3157039.1 hypothetical protein [Anaeromusa sp.]